MSKFERKFGKYAIRNLPLIMIICYVVGYILEYVNPKLLAYMTLDPYRIIHGQVWRLISWILIPPNESNIFFVLIMLFCIYSIGVSLEMTWGTYQYNIYILSGILFTILGAFILLAVGYITGGSLVAALYSESLSGYLSTYYINLSIILAYSVTFPEARFLFMFIIPVKAKWMSIIYLVILALEFVAGNMFSRIALAASLLNFFVFWLRTRRGFSISPRQTARKIKFERASTVRNDTGRSGGRITRHKCAICGRTEADSPDMQFRFCSKCEGNYEYCEEHLYTHTHVRRS